MGVWGEEPWDNDVAADWFGGLFDGTAIVERTKAGLTADDSWVMVGAIWLTTQLTRVYVWPIDELDATLDLAIAAAEQVLSGEDPDGYLECWDDDPEIRARVEGFRAELVERRSPPAST